MALSINWDEVSDDELEETYLERLEGLKEMFPNGVRSMVSKTNEWSCWFAKNSFWFTRNVVWIVSTSAFIMIMPYFIDKELQDVEKAQLKQQQQLLLGRT